MRTVKDRLWVGCILSFGVLLFLLGATQPLIVGTFYGDGSALSNILSGSSTSNYFATNVFQTFNVSNLNVDVISNFETITINTNVNITQSLTVQSNVTINGKVTIIQPGTLTIPTTNQIIVANANGVLSGGGPQLWTNSNGNVGINAFPTADKILYLSPYNGGKGTNTVIMNVKSVAGNPALADGFTLNFDYAGVGNVPAGMVVNLSQAPSQVAQETALYGAFYNNQTTNYDTLGWIYNQDASFGVEGEVTANQANSGAAVGVAGFTFTKSLLQAAVVGTASANANNQTNVGTASTVSKNSKTGLTTVGLYAEVAADGTVDPSMVSSVVLVDNRTTAIPLLLARSNSVTVASINNNGGLSVPTFTNTSSMISIDGIGYAWPASQTGGNLFNDGAGNLSWVAGTGVTIPNTITSTNFVLNTRYTNASGSIQLLDATVALVSAAVSGNTSLTLYSDQSGGSSFTVQDQAKITTLVTSIAATDTRNLIGAVSNNATYYFTNDSSGAGNSSSILAGTGEIVTLADGTAAGVASASTTMNMVGTANQVNISAGAQSLAANRTWTFSTPQNINAGASPAFNGINFTNQGFGLPTNNVGGGAYVFGGPGTAATLYDTNITAATTLKLFDISACGATAGGIKIHVTCSGGTDRILTFPAGCTGAGYGTPPAITITNGVAPKGAMFDVLYTPGAIPMTNVFWSPIF